MNHERQVRDIYIHSGSEWISINANSGSEEFKRYAIAYTQYKNRPTYHREVAYEAESGISVYRRIMIIIVQHLFHTDHAYFQSLTCWM